MAKSKTNQRNTKKQKKTQYMKKTTKKTTGQAKKTSRTTAMRETNGKQETFYPTTLEQIFGDNGMGTYGTLDSEKYWNKVQGMNKTDLQEEANRCGLMAIDDINRLRKSLYKKFLNYKNQYEAMSKEVEGDEGDEPTEVDEQAKRILSEGR